jgi:hypothetical protein
MTPDLQGYAGQCTLGSLAPKLLGQCPLGRRAFSPWHDPYTALACYLLAHLHRPFYLFSIDFQCSPLSISSCYYIAGCLRLVAQSAATFSRGFLARGFFYPEDGGDTFLRNVGSHKIDKAQHSRRRNSSFIIMLTIITCLCETLNLVVSLSISKS